MWGVDGLALMLKHMDGAGPGYLMVFTKPNSPLRISLVLSIAYIFFLVSWFGPMTSALYVPSHTSGSHFFQAWPQPTNFLWTLIFGHVIGVHRGLWDAPDCRPSNLVVFPLPIPPFAAIQNNKHCKWHADYFLAFKATIVCGQPGRLLPSVEVQVTPTLLPKQKHFCFLLAPPPK